MNTQPIITPPSQPRWTTPLLRHWTPSRIENTLRSALLHQSHTEQYELFQLMEDTWPRLRKNLNELRRAITRASYTAVPYTGDNDEPSPVAIQKADLITRAMKNFAPVPSAIHENTFEDTLYDITDAIPKGVSVLEVHWHQTAHGILPRTTSHIHPEHYGYPPNQPQTNLHLRIHPTSTTYTPFPADKFIIARNRTTTGHPWQQALLRPLAFWWCCANFSASWLLDLAQIFGIPIRVAKYSTAESGIMLQSAMENMGTAAWAVIPNDASLEIIANNANGGGNTPQESILNRADKLCDLLILGQTLTADAGDSGTQALGTIHEKIRADVIQGAAWWVADVINYQLIPSILKLNFGNTDEPPTLTPETISTPDPDKLVDRFQKMSTFMDVPQAYAQEKLSVPAPDDPSTPILRPKTASPNIPQILARLPESTRSHYAKQLQ